MKLLMLLFIGLILISNFVNAVPNPSTVYCDTLFPNQLRTFGTCRYAGRGENNRVICEGECGYGCICTPFCEEPSSEPCWRATDVEVKCICAGSSCERPCFFPDGSYCNMWDYYCKCNPEDNINCRKGGDYICDYLCRESPCKKAGESPFVFGCCEGLKSIKSAKAYDEKCETDNSLCGPGGICSDCGNNICEEWESKCNCPEDCLKLNMFQKIISWFKGLFRE